MFGRIVTNVHKDHGVIATLFGHGWEPHDRDAVIAEIERGIARYLVKDAPRNNPIRVIHGEHGPYLRTDPDPRRRNLGALAEPVRIEGLVTDQAGVPLEGAQVMLFDPRNEAGEQQPWTAVRSDLRGYFRFAALPEGAWCLVAAKEGFAAFEKRLELPRDADQPHRIRLYSW